MRNNGSYVCIALRRVVCSKLTLLSRLEKYRYVTDYKRFTMLFSVLSILVMTLKASQFSNFKNFTRSMTLKASPLGNRVV
jgi:hypothetical protein